MREATFVGKPVILVVVPEGERDRIIDELSARYGRDYDIRCAVTFAESLSVATRCLSEDRAIALLFAAPAVGGTSGIDIATAIHALSPTTRRVIIFGDDWNGSADQRDQVRDAAIAGRVDTYLWVPRGDRDEEFHAAITDVLSDWAWTSAPPVVEGVQIITDAWSTEFTRIVDFCQRMGIPYHRIHADSDRGRELIEASPVEVKFPLVVMYNGSYLAAPSLAQLGAIMYGTPQDLPEGLVSDLLVIGGGPSGLAAAVYGTSEGLSTLVIESEAIGGQAGTSSMIRNYLGFPRGISGMRLAQRARTQALRFGARFLVGYGVESVEFGDDNIKTVVLQDGSRVKGRSVVVATGSAYRRLGVESVEDLVGRGVHYGAAMSVARDTIGGDAVVVGGGNSAGQAAIHLARFAKRVTIVIRRPDLTATMSDYLIREIEDNPRISVLPNTVVEDAIGIDRLEGITLRNVTTGEESRVSATVLLLLLGAAPCVEWLDGKLATDAKGFVLTGRDLPKSSWVDGRPPEPYVTSVPGVFAVGDVRSGSMKRVASASGEGAGAVPLVHAYLAEIDAEPVESAPAAEAAGQEQSAGVA